MRFLCVNCGHIYDESLGEVEDGIEPGTCIDEIDEDIHCPMCDGSFDDFSPIEDEVIYIDDVHKMSHIEKEHFPHIDHHDSESIEVSIWWDSMHGSGEDHRITAIYLVDDEGHIVEEIFIMPDEDPVAEFDVSGLERFEIRSSCNQHGLWSSGLIEAIDSDDDTENS